MKSTSIKGQGRTQDEFAALRREWAAEYDAKDMFSKRTCLSAHREDVRDKRHSTSINEIRMFSFPLASHIKHHRSCCAWLAKLLL